MPTKSAREFLRAFPAAAPSVVSIEKSPPAGCESRHAGIGAFEDQRPAPPPNPASLVPRLSVDLWQSETSPATIPERETVRLRAPRETRKLLRPDETQALPRFANADFQCFRRASAR